MIFSNDIVSDIFIKLMRGETCGRKKFEIIGINLKADHNKFKHNSNESKRDLAEKQGKTSNNS